LLAATAARVRRVHALAFMAQLQRLFAEMELTNRRWVDPSACVRALFDFAGQVWQRRLQRKI
jgi:hypothetical protein